MDKFHITGETPLIGSIPVSGSKNAALPLMAAALLGDGKSVIRRVPRLKDIYTFNSVITYTGASIEFDENGHILYINPDDITKMEAPYDLVRKMRASFYMLGALLGRFGRARVSLPGGCAWGPRPVDLHLEGLRALGAEIQLDGGYVIANAPGGRLSGGKFTLNPSSVGATVNLLLGAVLAKGTSVINNAAREPDVVLLCNTLVRMGAQIDGIGGSKLTIRGLPHLSAFDVNNAPDRIETGTFMIAAAMHPDSKIILTGTDANDLGDFPEHFVKTGAELTMDKDSLTIKAPEHIHPVSIKTQIYPGFPTDLQAQWATLMTQASGSSIVTDSIYHDRFSYVPELIRLGADLEVEDNHVIVNGRNQLKGASVMSTDLRASVSLVIAATVAKGETEVLRVYHLDRGYETLEEKLNRVGARITRIKANQPY